MQQVSSRSTLSEDSETLLIGQYNHEGNNPGRLKLTTRSLTHSPDSTKERGWTIKFADLCSMHKVRGLFTRELVANF